MQILEFVVNN